MQAWRLILDNAQSAAFNMAADSYLLYLAENGKVPPVIRIYGWEELSITIGCHQPPEKAVDQKLLNGTPVARRITGGRALLHDKNELTYAVAGNFIEYPILGATLSESYKRISEAIILFYKRCGLYAKVAQRDNPILLSGKNDKQKGCFSSLSKYEITINGHKISAGSQRRTNSSMLQHGSVKITSPRFHPSINDFNQIAVDIPEMNIDRSRQWLQTALVEAFRQVMGVDLFSHGFSPQELRTIERNLADFMVF